MPSLEQWLAHQSQVHPNGIELGLERLQAVLERLLWRPPKVPVITVAGTNGKGSVSAFCASILTAAGHRVGTFTSPHLRDYRERIRVHDRLVSAAELISAFERIEAARGAVKLTFFEFNTLAALLVFEAARLDAWVLEIGMGGRLDAVNVVDPDVAVVVSIGFDHQEYLGNTLEAIAREKAGIFRPGRPAVLGSSAMPAVMETLARRIKAPLKRLGVEYKYSVEGTVWNYQGSRWNLARLPAPALAGATQYANAATAIAALEEIAPRLVIPATAIAQGLTKARLDARFQVVPAATPSTPKWILDVAHNPAAASVLAGNLRSLSCTGRTLAVFGLLADKDMPAVVEELRDCVDAWWCVPTDGERGRSAESLAATLRGLVEARAETAESVEVGCAAALAFANPDDRVVVFGSFHVVGPAIDWLVAHELMPPSSLGGYVERPAEIILR
jgi:dihydrofolate synthase/folylpolyglutamate synthase